MRRTRLLLAVAAVAALAVSLTVVGTASAFHTFTVRAETGYNSVDRKDKNVFCPEGSERTGGGAKIVDARKFVKLETSKPIEHDDGRTGWRGVAVENKHETGKKWKLVVHAVCEGLPGGR